MAAKFRFKKIQETIMSKSPESQYGPRRSELGPGDSLTVAHGETPNPNNTLYTEPYRAIYNGPYRAILQGDGNFVVYNMDSGEDLWQSRTPDLPRNTTRTLEWEGTRLVMKDGPRQVYQVVQDEDPGSRLVLRNDGALLIRRDDNTISWINGPFIPIPTAHLIMMGLRSELLPGQSLTVAHGEASNPNNTLYNGPYRAILQGDGNFVVYNINSRGDLWQSRTPDLPVGTTRTLEWEGTRLVMKDGPRQVYQAAQSGNPGSRLVLHNNGDLLIRRDDNTISWINELFKP
jgi:hypothetical protein